MASAVNIRRQERARNDKQIQLFNFEKEGGREKEGEKGRKSGRDGVHHSRRLAPLKHSVAERNAEVERLQHRVAVACVPKLSRTARTQFGTNTSSRSGLNSRVQRKTNVQAGTTKQLRRRVSRSFWGTWLQRQRGWRGRMRAAAENCVQLYLTLQALGPAGNKTGN